MAAAVYLGGLAFLVRRFERALDRPERGAGDLAVAGGGLQLVVTHEHLDHANVDLLLEKVGGKAVPERV